jgi:hypothetical protein
MPDVLGGVYEHLREPWPGAASLYALASSGIDAFFRGTLIHVVPENPKERLPAFFDEPRWSYSDPYLQKFFTTGKMAVDNRYGINYLWFFTEQLFR